MAMGLQACQPQKPTQQETPPPVVSVQTINLAPIALTETLSGRTLATETAEVRPQVNGIVEEILFQEGAMVQTGQPLYRINTDNYTSAVAGSEAALNQAQANVATAQAALISQQARYEQARADLARFQGLLEIDAISQQVYDNAITALKTAEAGVQQAQANLASTEATVKAAESGLAATRLDLERTIIKAPLTGKTGISSVTRGAMVAAGQGQSLVTISRLDPIYVDITQSSADILALRQRLADGSASQGSTEVELILEDGSLYPLRGELTFANAQVDEKTGSITLRAIFPNPEHLLLPGMYVNALLEQNVVNNAALLPQTAIIRTPDGKPTVALVDKTGKVQLRPVTLGGTHQGQWVVTEGLQNGDRVISVGGGKLKPAQQVTVKAETPSTPAPSTPSGQNSVLAPTTVPQTPAPQAPPQVQAPTPQVQQAKTTQAADNPPDLPSDSLVLSPEEEQALAQAD